MFSDTADGRSWWKDPPDHICNPPDISREDLFDQRMKSLVWRCWRCGKFYRAIEGGECMACPLWEWRRCWPWEDWWYKRRMRTSGKEMR